MGKRFFSCLLIFAFILGGSLPAWAFSYQDTVGVGTRALGMSGAMTGLADDYSAAHYNPAGLAQKTGTNITIDVVYINPDFEVNYLDGSGPLICYDWRGAERINPSKQADGDSLAMNFPIIGMDLDINQLASNIVDIPINIQMGMAITLPDGFRAAWTFHDTSPVAPNWLRYGDAIEHVGVGLGVGVEVIKRYLYLGAGAQMTVRVPGDVYVDALTPGTAPSQAFLNAQIELKAQTKWAGTAGIMITPFGNDLLRIGASYRDQAKMKVPLPIYPIVNAAFPFPLDYPLYLESLANWNPSEESYGVALNFERIWQQVPLTVSLDYNKQRWGDYDETMSYQYHLGLIPGIKLLQDTTNWAIGFEIRPTDMLSIRTGYGERESCVPDQSWIATNYLDFDKKLYSFGISYNLADLHKQVDFLNKILESLPIELGFAMQYQDCEDYTVYKRGTEPPFANNGVQSYPQKSYKVEGDAMVYGVTVDISF